YPYVALGLASFEFNSKGDLKDAGGNEYYYWTDGTIRNIPQNPETAGQSVIINRDYSYETDLRELNEDGLGKYSLIAFAIPAEFGVEMFFTDRFSMRAGFTYHFSLNDKVDNITRKGEGTREGNRRKDGFLFSFVSFHYDLFNKVIRPPYIEIIDTLDPIMFEFQDEDEDGINDFRDDCAYTPKGVRVGVNGCPLDTDRDGIGQDWDDEPETAYGAVVDLKGVTMTEDVPCDTNAVLHKDLYDWYPSLNPDRVQTGGWLVIPEKWERFDSDKDEYISFDEFNDVIDAWFDFKIELTIEEIMELNEFFFSQGGGF
ncbi:MAG: hypothetical protein KJ607_07850, partial [Bacteroidetes bacterium]|nr:hypothetical protein [Bacteroidota bacterium]